VFLSAAENQSILAEMTPRIGKTRQASTRVVREYDAAVAVRRGIVADTPPAGAFRHTRRAPPDDLAQWAEHFWTVRWDLRGYVPHEALTLPHPNVHLTIEAGQAAVVGVQTGAFRRVLRARGAVLGVKFKPGAFRSVLGRSVSALRDRTVPGRMVFGRQLDDAARELFDITPANERAAIETVADVLRCRLPPLDERADLARACVRRIFTPPAIHSVHDLAGETGIAKRSLQRLFTDYVGVPVKWVIRRYRLHEVVAAIGSGRVTDWTELALSLGYFDQAHLINDFRSLVGYAPGRALARSLGAQCDHRCQSCRLRRRHHGSDECRECQRRGRDAQCHRIPEGHTV
jgi:AraC-like DNA-binding protein